MSNVATKLKMGAAAGAIATAAALVQAPVAQAQPVAPAPEAIGGLLGITCVLGLGNECGTDIGTPAGLFYLGPRDGTPPTRFDFLVFYPAVPLSLIPVVGPVVAGWFSTLNLEVCVGGVSGRIGPYGKVSASVGQGC